MSTTWRRHSIRGEVGGLGTAATPRRLPAILASVAVVVAVVAAGMVATGSASPAIAFQATGHWVFNRAESAVAHVDGGTNQINARVAVPNAGPAPLFTLQGEKQGFVVGRQAVTVFGRSTLTVDSSFPTAGPEVPVGIEVLGGPYLVYQQAGTIVRLGVPPTTIQVGARVGRPTYTDDGTVWVHRTDNGVICALRRDSDALDCSAQAPPGLAGSLTVVSTSAAFVDTATDAAQIIDAPTAGGAVPLGVDLPVDTSLIADRDTQGRLPVVVPGPNRLLLADAAGVPAGREGGPPVAVGLGEGAFTSPVASDGIVAVVEQTHNRLLVFAVDGRSLGATDLPPGSGPASIMRGGDGRIYVDDADGAATHIVEADGAVKSVSTGGTVTAVTAPPPELAALVSPPSTRSPIVTGGVGSGGTPPVSVPPSGGPPPGGTRPNPNPNPPLGSGGPPASPSGVTAVMTAGGAVAVSWSGVRGIAIHYAVTANGTGAGDTTATSVVLGNLQIGTSYQFVVTAISADGRSAPSVPSRPITPIRAAAAPANLQAPRVPLSPPPDYRSRIRVDLTWDAPDLGGGQLVHYVVTGSQGGRALRTQIVTQPNATYLAQDDFDSCLPVVMDVHAVTQSPGAPAQRTLDGAVATTRFQDSICTPDVAIQSATPTGTAGVTVALSVAATTIAQATCVLRFNGTVEWQSNCGNGGSQQLSPVISGLQPSTTYSVTATVSNAYGSTTSPAVTVQANGP